MTAANLPRWVWDLVIHLQRAEAEHGPMYLDRTAEGQGFVPAPWCPKTALDEVPADVQANAAAIRAYVGDTPL